MIGIAREGGGRGGCTTEGVEVGKAASGMVYLQVHKGNLVRGPEGETPDRWIQFHVFVDANKPGLHEVMPLLGGEILLCQDEGMFSAEPISRFPGFEADEGGAGRGKGRVRNDEGSIKGVEATSRPEFPEAVRGFTRTMEVRVWSGEKADRVMRVGDGTPGMG